MAHPTKPIKKYFINGNPCSGNEYLALIDDVYVRKTPDVDQIELDNGEMISLGGNEIIVSILHHRHDGSVWKPDFNPNLKEQVTLLIGAFIRSDEETLSSYGAMLSKVSEAEKQNIIKKIYIDQVIKKIFIIFLTLAAIVIVCSSMIGFGKVGLAIGILCISVSIMSYTVWGGIRFIEYCKKFK